jgi:hypothetical protein
MRSSMANRFPTRRLWFPLAVPFSFSAILTIAQSLKTGL